MKSHEFIIIMLIEKPTSIYAKRMIPSTAYAFQKSAKPSDIVRSQHSIYLQRVRS